MAVAFDSSTSKFVTLVGGNGTVTTTHVVNSLATDLVTVVGALWAGNADTSSGSLAATFGGAAMTGSDVVRWDTNRAMMQIFTLVGPSTGSQTVSVTATGMPNTGSLAIVSATFAGVAAIGDIVSASPTSSTQNSVTVDSVAAAYRVVTIHGCGSGGISNSFSGYNLVQRASSIIYVPPFPYAEILLGDGPGAATVTGTATQGSSANWGAFGIPLSPAIVKGDSSLNVSMTTNGGGHLYRSGTPSPLRTWVIEA